MQVVRTDVTQMHSIDGLPNGTVLLVRSEAVEELGDHFVVITGPAVMKPHGLRPQVLVISADQDILNNYTRQPVILKLNENAQQRFFEEYGISMQGETVVSPPHVGCGRNHAVVQ